MPALPQADLVVTGGRIFRGRGLPLVEALAIREGRVLAAGPDREIAGLRGPGTRTMELDGRFACPGLIDAHLHLLPLGLMLEEVSCRPDRAGSVAAIAAAIRAKAATLPPGRWIVARGYDDTRLAERRHPTRDDLDLAAPDHPVYLARSCGHVAVGNSLALAAARIDGDTAPPPGGRIELRDGRPTGVLHETARNLLRAALPATSDADLIDGIERAGRLCLAHGLTTVMDAAVGARAGYREVRAYRSARTSGRLGPRVHLALIGGQGGIMDEALAEGLATGQGDEVLTVGPAKLFADGTAGARTAALAEGYEGRPTETGVLFLPDARIGDLVRRYHDGGFQVATHAVGDLAIGQVLDAYEAALGGGEEPGRRHRIEHATFATPEQVGRMARLGICPVPQPVFLHDYGAMYLRNVGPGRSAQAFAIRSWIAAGLRPAATTDCPVSELDPLGNLRALRSRRALTGAVLGPDEIVDPETALACCTEFGAYALRAEERVGRLGPGQAADLAVFSHDLLDPDPEVLEEARCLATLVGGRLAYEA